MIFGLVLLDSNMSRGVVGDEDGGSEEDAPNCAEAKLVGVRAGKG